MKDITEARFKELFQFQLNFEALEKQAEMKRQNRDKLEAGGKDWVPGTEKTVDLSNFLTNQIREDDYVLRSQTYFDGSNPEIGDVVLTFEEIVPKDFLQGRPEDEVINKKVCPRLMEKFMDWYGEDEKDNEGVSQFDLPSFRRK